MSDEEINGLLDRVLTARSGGKVKRFHVEYTHREQTVGEHSWGVATLIVILNPLAKASLLRAALFHDVGEISSGDLPHWAKAAHEGLREASRNIEEAHLVSHGFNYESELTAEELGWLRACDLLEACLSMVVEVQMGNRYLERDLHRALQKFQNAPHAWPKAVNDVGIKLAGRLTQHDVIKGKL
jgi:5'-deoxynucleotidase YfbR-like HD superfamily hydrolase